jgi:hypothetical protein
MGSQTTGLRVAATIFGLMCMVQLARFIAGIGIQVAGHAIPLWPSALAVVATGGLCVWLWTLSNGGGARRL